MFDANSVIQKRLLKISRGGRGAITESQRMVSEKVMASADDGIILSTGGVIGKVMSNYHKRVRANKRRLK